MGRKRKRYENTGNIQTVFTVNFCDPDQIDEIFEAFAENEVMCQVMAKLYCKMQVHLLDYDFSVEQSKSILEFAIDKTVANKVDMKEDLLVAATRAVESTLPAENKTNENFIKAFSAFFFSPPIAEQCRLYEMFGNELNTVL